MNSTNLERIRAQLQDEVATPELDIDKIVALSSELAREDPEFVRFSTDAAIISRLGRELVARQETAVAELIKNAYDADATAVILTFTDADQPGGSLRIEDDGLGMTRDQLVDGFMRLSSTDKVAHPYSPRYHRRRAGRKGIGRFAVQRLGEVLDISTQTAGELNGISVHVEWNEFEGGRDLATIANRVSTAPKAKDEGTSLLISHLREGWSDAAIRRVYRFVSELLQPFPLATSLSLTTAEGLDSAVADPGFKVSLLRRTGLAEDVIADEEVSIFSHALAEIEGFVDRDGHGYWSITSERYGINELVLPIGATREDSSRPYATLRNVAFKAYYFIHRAELIPRSMLVTIREMAQEKGGIRVYRNGFRVLPYGERDDDWLGLDASTRAREILPPHANSNFFGFVEIVDPEGARFEETSSREGLLENAAFSELQDFCSRVLKAAALRVAEARGRKGTAGQRDWAPETRDPSPTLRDIASDLAAAVGQSNAPTAVSGGKPEPSMLSSAVSKAAEALVRVADETEVREQELLAELGMLRVLASLGLAIGEFTHEVRQILGAAHISARHLMDALVGSQSHDAASDLYANIQRFRTYASYFYRAIAENTSRELMSQNLRHVINEFIESVKPAATRAGVKLEAEIKGYDLVTIPMHSSELASILFNFYSNSHKAIKRAHAQGRMLIRAGTDSDRVFIEFADNGDGIPPQHEDRIFNAFFTTSTPAGIEATEDEEMQGTGLGLKIVRDIVESYKGEVSVASPPEGFATCLRVELPRGSDEE
jgi:signal transduction histidine kinase